VFKWNELLGTLHRRSVMSRRSSRIATAISQLPIENTRILDVGSGNGMLALQIMKICPNANIVGVDVLKWPESMIETHIYDGEKLPWDDNEWDLCLISDVLHHAESPLQLLEEVARVAKRGLIIKDHIADTSFDRTLLHVMDWIGNRGHGVQLTYNYWSSQEWRAAFQKVGLTPKITFHSLYLYHPLLSWLLDRKLHFVQLLELSDN